MSKKQPKWRMPPLIFHQAVKSCKEFLTLVLNWEGSLLGESTCTNQTSVSRAGPHPISLPPTKMTLGQVFCLRMLPLFSFYESSVPLTSPLSPCLKSALELSWDCRKFPGLHDNLHVCKHFRNKPFRNEESPCPADSFHSALRKKGKNEPTGIGDTGRVREGEKGKETET